MLCLGEAQSTSVAHQSKHHATRGFSKCWRVEQTNGHHRPSRHRALPVTSRKAGVTRIPGRNGV
jgi:hypothetical protein